MLPADQPERGYMNPLQGHRRQGPLASQVTQSTQVQHSHWTARSPHAPGVEQKAPVSDRSGSRCPCHTPGSAHRPQMPGVSHQVSGAQASSERSAPRRPGSPSQMPGRGSGACLCGSEAQTRRDSEAPTLTDTRAGLPRATPGGPGAGGLAHEDGVPYAGGCGLDTVTWWNLLETRTSDFPCQQVKGSVWPGGTGLPLRLSCGARLLRVPQ